MGKIISSIDIGDSKIVCLIAQLSDNNNKIQIKSASIFESVGVVNGNIVNINSATQAIVQAIAKAEKIFKRNIDVLSVSISGDRTISRDFKTEMELTADKTIDKRNILSLSNELRETLEKKDRVLVHAVPLGFYANGIKIENPLGMLAKHLKIRFHALYFPRTKINNFVNCFRKIQLKIDSFVFSGYASALAVMTEEEKKINILTIDVGSSQTSFAFLKQNKFILGQSIPLGGDSITNDLKDILGTDFSTAESIKHLNTNLFFSEVENNELIKINIVNNDKELYRISKLRKGLINEVFKERFLEIINIILDILKNRNMNDVDKIIICGGTANVLGLDVFVSENTKIDTRIGFINSDNFSLSHVLDKDILREPLYATSMGILQYLSDSYKQESIDNIKNKKNNFINKIIDFLINLFVS